MRMRYLTAWSHRATCEQSRLLGQEAHGRRDEPASGIFVLVLMPATRERPGEAGRAAWPACCLCVSVCASLRLDFSSAQPKMLYPCWCPLMACSPLGEHGRPLPSLLKLRDIVSVLVQGRQIGNERTGLMSHTRGRNS